MSENFSLFETLFNRLFNAKARRRKERNYNFILKALKINVARIDVLRVTGV
jgi:hypothetical protein